MNPIRLIIIWAPFRMPGKVRKYDGSNTSHETDLVVVVVVVVV